MNPLTAPQDLWSFHDPSLALILFLFLALLVIGFVAWTILLRRTIQVRTRSLEAEIEERRQAEEALRASEEKFRQLSNLLPQIVFETDLEGNLTFINKQTHPMLGYGEEDGLLGRNSFEFYAPASRARVMEDFRKRISGGATANNHYTMLRKDGSTFEALIYSNPIIENGQTIGIRGILVDITETLRVQESLKESEARFRSYFELPLAGRAISSPEKGWLEVNQALCNMLGYPRDELTKKTWDELTHPDDLEANLSQFRRAMNGEIDGYMLEKRFLRKDGSVLQAELAVHCLRKPDGSVNYFVVLIQDIGERKQAREVLQNNEKYLRRLVEKAPIGLALISSINGATLLANNRFVEMFGYAPEDIPNVQDWWLKAYPNENYRLQVMAEWNKAVEQSLREGVDIGMQQLTITCKDGSQRIAEVTGIPIGDNFLVTFMDITQRRQAEEALRQNQELFSLYMRHSPIYTYIKEVTETESRAIQMSENFFNLIGIPNEESLGRPMHELFPPEFAAKITAEDIAVVNSGEVLKVDEILSGRNYITIKFPIYLGEKKMLAGYTIDITERVQAEEQAHRMAKRWSTVYRAGEEITASLDAENIYQAVYRALEQVMPCEDFLVCLYDPSTNMISGDFILEKGVRMGVDPYAATRGLGGWVVHESRPVLLNSPQEIKDSGIDFVTYGSGPVTSSVLAVPLQIYGRTIGMVSVQSYRSNAYTIDDQELLLMLAGHAATAIENAKLFDQAQREIQERRQSEEALRESEQKYRKIVETSIEGIISLDQNAVIVYLNRQMASMLDYEVEELVGTPFVSLLPPDQIEDHAAQMEIRAKGLPSVYERCLLSKSGERRWVMISANPEIGPDGTYAGSFGMISDITDRKRSEEMVKRLNLELEERVEERTMELKEAQEQLVRHEKLAVLGQMASSIGHELRNPLAVINSAVYYLKFIQPDADEKIKKYLGIIDDEVHNSDKIISDLLDFARIKSMEREPVKVPQLVYQTLERFPVPSSIEVDLDLPADLPPVFVDPRQMIQVLGNLTVNACQAMASVKNGRLSLYSRKQDDMIIIKILDNGTGISPENLSRIFEPLYTTKPRGIGLGLAVSQKLVTANEGRIEVESELGVGSSFCVFLPVYKERS